MDYIWQWFSNYGLVSTEEKLQKLREMEENAVSSKSDYDTEKGSFDSDDSNSNGSISISSQHEDSLRKGSKIKQKRRNEIDIHQGQGCRLIGRSLSAFAGIVAAFIMFIVLQGKHVEVKINPRIGDGADIEMEHGYTLPVQCRAPCADSRQKAIAELVLGHTVCPCDAIGTNSTSSASSTNSTNSIDTCICTPEEMALKWMIEEDSHYTYNEVDDAVSKTFLMERFVLATFYYATIGFDHDDDTYNNHNPYKDTNWLSRKYYFNGMNGGKENKSASTSVDHCEWEGIACNNVGVTDLSLPDYGLTGTIPKLLGALHKLERLYLPHNEFISTIPSQLIVKLKNLIDLDLAGNKVSGTIPTELGGMSNLISIKLGMGDWYGGGGSDDDDDVIIGSIPTELGQLYYLEHLSISNTKINGNIPVELGQLTSLKTLSLGMNDIGGSIPTEIETMLQLEVLDLHLNNLTGGIPNAIGDLLLLKSIDLSYNNLNGVISDADFLPLVPTLRDLNLSYNNLTGAIPLKLGEFKVLEMVDVSSNLFTGEVSENLGKPPNLTMLNLSDNPFLEGVIPEELCNIRLSRDTFHSLRANCDMCPEEVGEKGCCTSCHN